MVIFKKFKKYLKFWFDPFRSGKNSETFFSDPNPTSPIASPDVYFISNKIKLDI